MDHLKSRKTGICSHRVVAPGVNWKIQEVQEMQARSKHKMTGRAERLAHINSPPPFAPSVKAYFLVHVRSLHLSTIPFVLVSNFPFVLTLTEYSRSRKICKHLLSSGCSLIRIVCSTTPGSLSLKCMVLPTIKVFPAYFRLVWISLLAAVAKTL